MKSLEDLKKIRNEAAKKMNLRHQKEDFRVNIGMATCGITAGAREVLHAFVDEIEKRNLENVVITQVGCIGQCSLEPMVEVINKLGQKFTYGNVKPQDCATIIDEHILKGQVVERLLVQERNG